MTPRLRAVKLAMVALVLPAFLVAGCGGGGGGGGGTSTIPIVPAVLVNIATTTVPDGSLGGLYSATVTASDGVDTSYAWSIAQGALPPGISLGSSGVPSTQLSGTPTSAGTFNFSILVRDAGNYTDIQSYSIEIAPALTITTTTLTAAVQGTGYSQAISATDGSGAGYAWSISAGALPAGLSLGASGTPSTAITGTPTASGAFNFTVRVQDGAGAVATRALSLTVNAPLAITTLTLPTATAQQPYGAQITATGGVGTYLWQRSAGSLPAGLSFLPRATPSTSFFGTPTAAGASNFTVEVIDQAGNRAQQTFDLTVNPAIAISTTSPLTAGVAGTPVSITLTGAGGSSAGYSWSVASGTLPSGMTLTASGTPSTALTGTPANDGAFSFSIRLEDSLGAFVTKAFALTINPGLDIATPGGALAAATVGLPFADRLTGANGSLAGYTWSISSGTLPAGVTLVASGTPSTRFAGAPTAPGASSFTVLLTDSIGNTATESFSITVSAAPTNLEILTRTLPAATSGTAYAAMLEARGGGGASHAWTLVGSAEPAPGLALAVNGAISGVPTATGVYVFKASVSDTLTTVEREFSISVRSDQRWLLYRADERANDVFEMFVVNISGAPTPSAPLLTPFPAANDVPSSTSFYALSPDGDWAVFRIDNVSGTADPYYASDLRGSAPVTATAITPVLSTANCVSFQWSPGSRQLLVSGNLLAGASNKATDLFLVDFRSGAPAPPVSVTPVVATTTADIWSSDPGVKWSFSPDGKKVAYLFDEVNQIYELWVADVSGGVPGTPVRVNAPLAIPLSSSLDVEEFTWVGNDGIVYYGDAAGSTSQLHFVNLAAPGGPTSAPLVSNATVSSIDPVIVSPDGKRLLVIDDLVTTGRNELFLIDVTSGTPTAPRRLNLPLTTFGTVASAEWSPDGNRILYGADENASGVNELFLVDLSGSLVGGPQAISGSVTATNDPNVTASGSTFSPDSKRIAYRNTVTKVELLTVDATGILPAPAVAANVTLVDTTSSVDAFVFSPDSTKLVIGGDIDVNSRNEIYVFTLGGGPATKLHAAYTTSGQGIQTVATEVFWSRDSQRVFYRARQDLTTVSEVYSASATAPPSTTKLSTTTATPNVREATALKAQD